MPTANAATKVKLSSSASPRKMRVIFSSTGPRVWWSGEGRMLVARPSTGRTRPDEEDRKTRRSCCAPFVEGLGAEPGVKMYDFYACHSQKRYSAFVNGKR